eukprot:TRINITY_DN2069_c0_g1_i1.p2 TRINITY_DN2069_c0_g1~~TRINITY_DN2069_c0_g1_i1.p2  ORF type:complete len:336 (-),score=91.17 TRINITY_DN2069_c0_g1_i1:1224-2177(-)
MATVFSLATILFLALVSVSAAIEVKKLAGPPSEFSIYDFPDPSENALFSQSALIPIDLNPNPTVHLYLNAKVNVQNDVLHWVAELPVDSESVFMLSFASPIEQFLEIELLDPSLNVIPLDNPIYSPIAIDSITVPSTSYIFENPIIGVYTLHIYGNNSDIKNSGLDSLQNDDPEAYVLWFNESPIQIASQLSTYELHKGSPLGLGVNVFDASLLGNSTPEGRPDALLLDDISATMNVVFPDGSQVDAPMSDDSDGPISNDDDEDGDYGAEVTATQTGYYMFQATVQGTTPDGVQFIRTVEHLASVVVDNADYILSFH